MSQIRLTWQRLSFTLTVITSLWVAAITTTQAVQLADGTVAFANPPKLLDAVSTFREVRARGAKYYFTLDLPKTADEPLQKITINLRQGADEIEYQLDQTIAAVGTASNQSQKIAIASTSFEPKTETVTVTFAQPIPAGTIFTVGLRPVRNPNFDGTYLFGITAFPDGEKSQGIYLGAARLQFNDSDDYTFGI